eukprot:365981-Chlamydomonas_euryale.AAC.20
MLQLQAPRALFKSASHKKCEGKSRQQLTLRPLCTGTCVPAALSACSVKWRASKVCVCSHAGRSVRSVARWQTASAALLASHTRGDTLMAFAALLAAACSGNSAHAVRAAAGGCALKVLTLICTAQRTHAFAAAPKAQAAGDAALAWPAHVW